MNVQEKIFRGGIRIGESYMGGINITWPFVRLEVSVDQIEIRAFWKKWIFPNKSIKKVTLYKGFFSRGIRIEHEISSAPKFIVFWSFCPQKVLESLKDTGLA